MTPKVQCTKGKYTTCERPSLQDEKTVFFQYSWAENICYHKSDKGLVCRIKEQSKKTVNNNSTRKWTKDMNRHFTKEEI